MFCPYCESKHIMNNSKIHKDKQNHKFKDYGRLFVEIRQ
ncbi:IS1/IS1595 family N-terminal zinc-binding domain-containing protein [Hyella patelloides]